MVTGAGDVTTFNSQEGVLYAEIAALANDNTYRNISISDGTLYNAVIFSFTNTDNKVNAVLRSGGSGYGNLFHTLTDIKTFNDYVIVWKSGEFTLYVNGINEITQSFSETPISLSELSFNNVSSAPFYGKTKALKVYKSIAEAQADLPYIN